MDTAGLILVALAIAVGLIGTVVVAIPGLILVWAAVGVWAIMERSPLAWIVLAIATALLAVGQVVKYTVPGRRLKEAGVSRRALLLGSLLGLIGFFVIPVVGLVLGFVLGVYLTERLRLGDSKKAWTSTKLAMKAAGLSIVIEMAAGSAIAVVWLGAVLISGV
jgi:uncharacterized protein YqgC (DUF456 family)